MDEVPLALLLLRASRWFDRQLLDRLESAGWPRLTAAQSLVFAHLPADGAAPAALARALGTSRQGAHELVAGLVRLDLLAVVDDPARAGGRRVVLTDRGRALSADAGRTLSALEVELGADRSAGLRALLQPFGATPPP